MSLFVSIIYMQTWFHRAEFCSLQEKDTGNPKSPFTTMDSSALPCLLAQAAGS